MSEAAEIIRRNIATVKQAQPLSCFIMTPLRHNLSKFGTKDFREHFIKSLDEFCIKQREFLGSKLDKGKHDLLRYPKPCDQYRIPHYGVNVSPKTVLLNSIDADTSNLNFLNNVLPKSTIAISGFINLVAAEDDISGIGRIYRAPPDPMPELNFGVYPFACFYDYLIGRRVEEILPTYERMVREEKNSLNFVFQDLLKKVEHDMEFDRESFIDDAKNLQLSADEISEFLKFEELPTNGHIIVLDPLDTPNSVRSIVFNMCYIAFAKAFRVKVVVPCKIDMTEGAWRIYTDQKSIQQKVGWAIGSNTLRRECDTNCIFNCFANAFYYCVESQTCWTSPNNAELIESLYAPPDGVIYKKLLQKYDNLNGEGDTEEPQQAKKAKLM